MSGDIDDALDQLLLARYQEGESTVRLAVDFAVSRRYINALITRAGLPRRRHPTVDTITDEQRQQLIRAHAAGLSGTDASYLSGLPIQVVYGVWQREGLTRLRRISRKKGRASLPRAPGQRDDWIEIQYRDGLSMERIAHAAGISRTTVKKVLKSRGVPIRPRVRYRKLTPGQEHDIVRRYTHGASLEQLSHEFHITTYTVTATLHRHGVNTRAQPPRFTSQQAAQLAARYTAGESAEALAAETGTTTRTILSTIRRAGHTTRTPGRPGHHITAEQAADITRRYIAGEPVANIASDYNIARPRVIKIAVEGGATPRKVRRAKGSVKRRGGKRDTRNRH